MSKTIQIRELDDDVYASLLRHAGEAGITVPELLRREATRVASRPSMSSWLARMDRPSTGEADRVVVALDELRGEWPVADC
jgi:hypothetical protein